MPRTSTFTDMQTTTCPTCNAPLHVAKYYSARVVLSLEPGESVHDFPMFVLGNLRSWYKDITPGQGKVCVTCATKRDRFLCRLGIIFLVLAAGAFALFCISISHSPDSDFARGPWSAVSIIGAFVSLVAGLALFVPKITANNPLNWHKTPESLRDFLSQLFVEHATKEHPQRIGLSYVSLSIGELLKFDRYRAENAGE